MIVPGAGAKPRAGSSALIRISIACPRRGARPVAASGSPAARRICCTNDVDPGRELGDRVLDLEPAVHLDEVRLAVRAEQELERAGVLVADVPAGALDAGLHGLARLGW